MSRFDKIIIIADRDEVGSEDDFIQKLEECKLFVESVDPERRYLKKRRYITKAKFDVYFSIRTALEQFKERRNILRKVPWEDYLLVQECFSKLEELHV